MDVRLQLKKTIVAVSKEDFKAATILLIFGGLDTFATIHVNQNEIGKTANMFVRHMFDVKDYIKVMNRTVTSSLYIH